MTRALLHAILSGYALPRDGIHGLRHWARVQENGHRLSRLTGADPHVVDLFALFHDCRRVNEGTDRKHGLRGGELARVLRDRGTLEVSIPQLDLLHYACTHHTGGKVDGDITIQTCWDADRLDLGRVGITPDPRYLCTPAAKDPAMIDWAEERSGRDHSPPIVNTWLSWAEGAG